MTENWDDIVLVDGLKAAKSLVDTRTDLECVRLETSGYSAIFIFIHSNELGTLPAGTQPKYPVVQDKLALMEKRISELNAVITKLVSSSLDVIYTLSYEVLHYS